MAHCDVHQCCPPLSLPTASSSDHDNARAACAQTRLKGTGVGLELFRSIFEHGAAGSSQRSPLMLSRCPDLPRDPAGPARNQGLPAAGGGVMLAAKRGRRAAPERGAGA
jgi:hypothetical protein